MPVKKTTPKKSARQLSEPAEVRIVFNEMGTSGLKTQGNFVSEAYNQTLNYPNAFTFYERIRRSMPEIVMVRRTFESWARSTKPIVDLPEKPSDDDKRYQDFIIQDFDNMDGGYSSFIETALSHTPFMGLGWSDVALSRREFDWVPPSYTGSDGKAWADEWRSEYDDGLIGIRRIAFRSMSSFAGWELDGRKRAIGFIQQDYPNPKVTLHKDKSLHLTFGDRNNPEGLTPLEAVWRTERLKYGFEVVMGIGFEHSAGYLKVWKTQKGDISRGAESAIKAAARAILSASEGNYAAFPYGYDGEVRDVGFQSAGSLLDTIQYYGILSLSMYMMQFIALNTMTNTGALASMQDSTKSAILAFNTMLDGFAEQYDNQIGKRLYALNKEQFPGITKRPKIRFSHIYSDVMPSELGSFLSTMDRVMPLGVDDYKAIRSRIEWLPSNNPEPKDQLNEFGKAKPQPSFAPSRPAPDTFPNAEGDDTLDEESTGTKQVINQALRMHSRSTRLLVK